MPALTESQASLIHQPPDPIPQFFVSVVNDSQTVLTVTSLYASDGCGWVQEPYVGESIGAAAERVWCGMPWDMAGPISLTLTLASLDAGEIRLSLHRPANAAATLALHCTATSFTAHAELARAESTSPYVLVTVRTASPAK